MDKPSSSTQAIEQVSDEQNKDGKYSEKMGQLTDLLDELRDMRHPDYLKDLKDLTMQLQESLNHEQLLSDLQLDHVLEADVDVTVLLKDLRTRSEEATRLYLSGEMDKAYKLSRAVCGREGMYKDGLPVHIALLVGLAKSNELFRLAHKLVDKRPEWPLSWYAVGCYYFSIANLPAAKRFLCKSTAMDQTSGDGWVLFGHVFAKENEHDQAMNCYLKASRLMPTRHEPLLYLGMEYAFANNASLAKDFLSEAATISPDDPRILHEKGSIAFCLDKNYSAAEKLLKKALRLVYKATDTTDVLELLRKPLAECWEPLVNNLGHVSRKLSRYHDAIAFHRKSLLLCPRKSSTLGALGVAYVCSGQVEQGVDCLHQSLSLKPNDSVIKLFLKNTLELVDQCPWVWSNGPLITLGPLPIIEPEPISKLPRRTRSQRSSVLSAMNESRQTNRSVNSTIEDVEMDMD